MYMPSANLVFVFILNDQNSQNESQDLQNTIEFLIDAFFFLTDTFI